MTIKRWILVASGILAGMLLAVFAGAPAQAATVTHHNASGSMLTAPPAPSGAQLLLVRPDAVTPTISPSVTTGYTSASGGYSCPYGDLCALVWDPTKSNWKIFYLYSCARYSLYNWLDTGYYFDNQTAGTVSTFYGSSGNALKTFTPDQKQHSYGWTPVYSIRNC